MQESPRDYELLVLGAGPAGQRAAIQAAKLERRVAIVEQEAVVGGVCVNTGTIPSKTLREAVLHLSGYRQREVYGASYAVKQNITIDDLRLRTDHVVRHELDVVRHQLMRNRVEVLTATASFVDPHTVRLTSVDGRGVRLVTADNVVIATGTTSTRDPHIPLDGQRVFLSDDIPSLDRLPRTLAVVGGG
jgi:NAD(P) transhydrogenase